MEAPPQNIPVKAEMTPVKEGIDFVYEQTPALADIGTKEQYSEYLETIFPESKMKQVVYHGTASKGKIEKFDFTKSNFAKAVFFTDDLNFAKHFAFDEVRDGSVQAQILDIRNSFDYSNPEHIEELRGIIKGLVEEGYVSSTGVSFKNDLPTVYNGEKVVENPSVDDILEFYMWRLRNGSWRILETDRIVDYISKNHDSIKIVEKGATNIAVFSENQIFVLGSDRDVERFKKFTA